ncbi:hypothetical protein [Schwartzia sp. (in: firmicutes)]
MRLLDEGTAESGRLAFLPVFNKLYEPGEGFLLEMNGMPLRGGAEHGKESDADTQR